MSGFNSKQSEVLRLIQQYLCDQGLGKIAKEIQSQTKISMEDQSVHLFRQYILNGEYTQLFQKEQVTQNDRSCKKGEKQNNTKLLSVFDKVTSQIQSQKKQEIMYYIYEQQYKELMASGNNIEAISLLQKQLVPRSPYGRDKANLFKLASMIMIKPICNPSDQTKIQMEFEGSFSNGQMQSKTNSPTDDLNKIFKTQRQKLLESLHQLLPQNSMLLPKRLEQLLDQSIDHQVQQCPYHNIGNEQEYSLLNDHVCPQSLLPTSCLMTLRKHKDQVFYCKFNDQGDKILTVCRNGQMLVWYVNSKKQDIYKISLAYDIKEHTKQVTCVCWAPNGDWIASSSNKDHQIRIWDVSSPDRHSKIKLHNSMVCVLKKHTHMITKVQFHSDTILVSSGQEHSIIIWELQKFVKQGSNPSITYKGKVVRKIANTKFYQEIIITKERFICRKGTPGGEIKIIKFKDFKKDLNQEVFTEEFYKKLQKRSLELKDPEQDIVHHIDKLDDKIMDMVVTECGNFLLLNLQKPRLELWDLRKSPVPQCVQRYFSPNNQMNQCIITPCFAGINQSFVVCGSESTGEEASINIWKRDTGELLYKIPGSGIQGNGHSGHSNMINQVHSTTGMPYLFLSCSDDETVKIWGVNEKIKLEMVQIGQQTYKKVDVKNEEIEASEDPAQNNRRSRSRSGRARDLPSQRQGSGSSGSSQSSPSSSQSSEEDNSNNSGSEDDSSDDEDFSEQEGSQNQSDEYDQEFNPDNEEEMKDSQDNISRVEEPNYNDNNAGENEGGSQMIISDIQMVEDNREVDPESMSQDDDNTYRINQQSEEQIQNEWTNQWNQQVNSQSNHTNNDEYRW